MHTRLDIACTVAASVQVCDYANHSRNYLYYHLPDECLISVGTAGGYHRPVSVQSSGEKVSHWSLPSTLLNVIKDEVRIQHVL